MGECMGLRARVVRMHLSGRFRRIVRYKEECPLEVVRVHLEEFDELVKLDQLVGHWFCRFTSFFVKDEIIMLLAYCAYLQVKCSFRS